MELGYRKDEYNIIKQSSLIMALFSSQIFFVFGTVAFRFYLTNIDWSHKLYVNCTVSFYFFIYI